MQKKIKFDSEPLNEYPMEDNIVVDFDKYEEDIDESKDEFVNVVDIKTVNTSIADWKLYALKRKDKEYCKWNGEINVRWA